MQNSYGIILNRRSLFFQANFMKLEMPSFQEARILLVGDVMLDRYWHGSASRISPEAPVPVVRVANQEDRPGGAGQRCSQHLRFGKRDASCWNSGG